MHLRRMVLTLASIAGIGLLGFGFSCEAQDAAPRPDLMPTQPGWSTPLHNPVLPAGSLVPRALWNDPSPMKDGAETVLYATTSIDQPFKPPIVPFRLVSTDRATWRLDPPEPVAVPDGSVFVSVETPSVVVFRGQYHMYFSGIYPAGAPTLMAIGHAVSPDGKHFTVSPRPVLEQTGTITDWNGYLVGEPGAIVRGGEIFVYFSAAGARPGGDPPQYQTIGLARTTDGEHFGGMTKVLEQDALFSATKGFVGYSTPAPFDLDGRVHLVFDVALHQSSARPNWQQVALRHAVSMTDGTGGFVQDAAPIFTRNSFSWTGGEVIGPAVLVDGDTVEMWFGGHVPVSALGPLVSRGYRGEEFGINYATLPLADLRAAVAAIPAASVHATR